MKKFFDNAFDIMVFVFGFAIIGCGVVGAFMCLHDSLKFIK